MDQDVVIDDVVDTQTFDLSELTEKVKNKKTLTENNTIEKTFTFGKVGEKRRSVYWYRSQMLIGFYLLIHFSTDSTF